MNQYIFVAFMLQSGLHMSFGLMSPSALYRIRVNVVRLNVAFGLMSLWLMSFGLKSHSAICHSV